MAGSVTAVAHSARRLISDNAAMTLLRADLLPVSAAILGTILDNPPVTMDVAEFLKRDDDGLDQLRDIGVDAPQAAQSYLTTWIGQGLVARQPDRGRMETVRLSPAALDAMGSLRRLEHPQSTVTSSRLATVTGLLRRLARSTDPSQEARLADLRRWASAKYRRNHRAWIVDAQLTTTLALGTPIERRVLADPDAVAASASGWGRQTSPARVRVVSPEGIAELAEQGQTWRRSLQIAADLRSHWLDSDYLGDALPRLIDDVTALDDADIRRLLAMADWLVDHPESGLMPRQVAAPGIDTKWLERHRGIVERLMTTITGQIGMELADEPQRFRIRVLATWMEIASLRVVAIRR